MANVITNTGRQGFLAASHGWTGPAATWVPYIVGSMGVTPVGITFLSDIPVAVWRARGTYLTTKTTASGIADADDTVVVAVGSAGSATAVYVVLVNETGASQTSLVGVVDDTVGALPFLPNGGDIQIQWDNGANKIFAL